MATNTLGVRLDDETQHRLKALGEARDRSPHYLMKEAVARYLDREEAELAELKLMNERWERYEITGEAIDHADVEKWLEQKIKPASKEAS